MLDWIRRIFGRLLAEYISRERPCGPLYTDSSVEQMLAVLQPGDVVLVEGTSRVSTVIKYLTQSTWSHSAIFVGDVVNTGPLAGTPVLIEADTVRGVVPVPVSRYQSFNTRICRPVGLRDEDRESVVRYLLGQLGRQYDMKHIFDLARYLVPVVPVPARFRRRLIAFGSEDPTRAICSSLIAEAFHLVHFPILPKRFCEEADQSCMPERPSDGALLAQRHYSHFMPRDFDVSPYFEVVKPRLARGFDYKSLRWGGTAIRSPRASVTEMPPRDVSEGAGRAHS